MAPETVREAHVTVQSNQRVSLQKRVAEGAWSEICVSPCTTDVRVGSSVRIEGPRISQPVVLTDGPQHLDVRVGSEGARTTGFVLVVGGVLALGGGMLARSLGTACDEDCDSQSKSSTRDAGTGLLLGGAIALVAGAALLIAIRRASESTTQSR